MASSTDKKHRPYISSRFVLELDDNGSKPKYVGTLQSIEGGGLKSEVVDEKVGGESLVTKYPGRPKFEDVTIQVGMAIAPRFWKWIKESFRYHAQRRNGAIVALDFDNKERWRRNFYGALIREVTFPQLDGAAKEPAYLTVKFAPENIKEVSNLNVPYQAEQEHKEEWEKQRQWLPSNFTFHVDSFNSDNPQTAKVDSFTVKQEIIECPVGGHLEITKEPGRVEFPNLAVTILQRDADPWVKWWEEFVRHGKHAQSAEKTGHISYLGRDVVGSGSQSKKPLMTVNIYGMGVLGISPVKHDSKQAQLQRVKIDLYCERMEIAPGEGTE